MTRWLNGLSERNRIFITVAALSAAAVLLIWAGGLFMAVRLRATDLYFIGQPAQQNAPHERIALIAIDDLSFQTFGRALNEWDRTVYSQVVDRVAADGARVIAMDILFSESSASDDAVAEALARARTSDSRTRIVLPLAGLGAPLPPQRQLGGGLLDDERRLARAVRFSNRLAPVAVLAEQADYLAYVNTVIDTDGIVRRQPSLVQSAETIRFGFAMATYLAFLRVPEAASSQVVQVLADGVRIADAVRVPTDDLGLWRQDFIGQSQQAFPVYSFADVANGSVEAGAFTDRVVFIGLMNSQGIADAYVVPVNADGQFMAGVEILAHAVATLMNGTVPYEQTPAATAAMLIAQVVIGAGVYTRVRWWGKLLLMPIYLVAMFIIGSVLFSTRGELISLFDYALATTIPMVLALGFEIRVERRSRLRAEALFATADGQRSLIDAVFRRSPMPIAVVDGGLRLVRHNDAFQSLFQPYHDAVPIPENTWAIGLFLAAGMEAEGQDDIQRAVTASAPAPTKLKLGTRTFLLGTAAIDSSLCHVVSLTEVTDLEELAVLKTRLIRIAAHDVRNPLSSIIGFTDLISISDDSLPKRINEMLSRIKMSAVTINVILSNVLKLEQLRSAVLPLEPLSLSGLANNVATGAAPDMERRRHDFIIDIPRDDLIMMQGEPVQLGQAISNLLSNAAKYTPDGGRVRLNVRRKSPTMGIIEVIDNGFGIAPDAQKELFTEFYRVRSSSVSKIEGTGLGLNLVRTIVEAHRGRVSVSSAEGKGSTFTIELPLIEAPSPGANDA